ncbi:protein-L-isoaspartate O-methyltransferase [Abortiporus biennis]|nr:protein-L-isoaspartate O-methyltransferase [Abortiporus biennis]
MAWRCSGTTNNELIDNMVKAKLIQADSVAAAMKSVDRANYIYYENLKDQTYDDSPLPIGYAHAYALENLLPFFKPGSKVLDVGSGSGYLCAVIHHLIGPTGKVVGIDHISELVSRSVSNLVNDGLNKALLSGSIQMVTGDGRKGYPSEGPYDAIHVGAAAPVIPQDLIEQLASPGRMFIPVGSELENQRLFQVDKDQDGKVTQKDLFGVMYVPLTDEAKQREAARS